MLEKDHLGRRITGVKASIRDPAIHHVMYADDIVLFTKANTREAQVVNYCLDKYCRWLGQLANRRKFGITVFEAT